MSTNITSIRIFLIATLRDMHAEREILIKKVFPELQKHCQQHNIKFEIADLHYKMREDFDIRNTYRQEIDQSQIIIALVGEHYGFIPNDSTTSFLEDEINYGVLQAEESRRKQCHVYFRNLRSCLRVPTELWQDYWEDEGEPRYDKLKDLKQKIRNSGVANSEYNALWDEEADVAWSQQKGRFINLDGFAETITKDIRQIIQNLSPEIFKLDTTTPSNGVIHQTTSDNIPQIANQDIAQPLPTKAIDTLTDTTVMQYVYEHTIPKLIGRDALLQEMKNLTINKPEGYVLLVGDSGIGKSALLTYFVQELYKQENLNKEKASKENVSKTTIATKIANINNPTPKSLLLIPVHIGMTARSRDVRWVLEHICHELEKALAKNTSHPKNFETLRDLLPTLLESAVEKYKVIIILDGIADLMACHQAHQFYWLPAYLPTGVYVFFGTDSNTFEMKLKKRFRAEQITISQLASPNQRELLNSYIQEYKITMAESDINMMLSKKESGLPLYLQLATASIASELQETNIQDVGTIVSQLPETLDELVANVLQRWEQHFGYDITARFFSTLAVSRSAIAVHQVRKFLQGDAPDYLFGGIWTQLAKEITPYVWQIHDHLQLRHSRIQTAVAKRYLLLENARMDAHKRLASFLEQQGYSSFITLLELPYHWIQACCWNKVLYLLTDINFVEAKAISGMVTQYHQDLWLALMNPSFPTKLQIPLTKPRQNMPEKIQTRATTLPVIEPAQSKIGPTKIMSIVAGRETTKVITRKIRPTENDSTSTQKTTSNTLPADLQDDDEQISPPMNTMKFVKSKIQASQNMLEPGENRPFDTPINLEENAEEDVTLNVATDYIAEESLAPNQALGYNTLYILYRALTLDLAFLTEYPQEIFSCLWNRCYWYDSPETAKHFIGSEIKGKQFPWQAEGSLVYSLMELWQQHKQTLHTFWLRSKRPLEPHLDSPLRCVLRASLGISALAYSHDGKLLAAGSWDNTTRIWDIATATCVMILKGHTQWVQSVEFSPSDTELVTGSRDKTVRIWDVESGKCVKTFRGHTNWIGSVVYSRDGHYVASASFDETAKIWDVGTGQCIKTLKGHKGAVTCVALHKNGLWIATSSQDNTIRIWEIASGNCIKILKGHTDSVEKIIFSSDCSKLASASFDTTVRIWNPEPDLSMVGSLSNWFKESTNMFQSGTDCMKVLSGHTGKVTSLYFNSDDRLLVTGSWDRTARIWQTDTGTCVQVLTGHEDSITAVIFSPDNKNVVTGSQDKMVRIWAMSATYDNMSMHNHSDVVQSLAFSSTAPYYLATGAQDKIVSLWDVQTGQWIGDFKGHEDLIYDVAFSPDSCLLATASQDKTIRLWNVQNRQMQKKLAGHQDWVRCIAFSPDNSQLASGGHDKTIRIWKVADGNCIRIISNIKDYVRCIAYSLDSKMIIAGCGDKAVRIYRTDGQCIKSLEGMSDIPTQIILSANGQQIWVTSPSEIRSIVMEQDSWQNILTWKQAEQMVLATGKLCAFGEHNTTIWSAKGINYIPDELSTIRISGSHLAGCGRSYKHCVYLFEIMGQAQ